MDLKPLDGLREALDRLLASQPELYREVFLDGESAVPRPEDALLVEAGLMDRRGRPRVRLIPFQGSFIATDRLDYRREDQVFSLLFEQHYLARNSSLGDGDRVLELCSGSGAYCVHAADRASAVTGVDISPRAIAFAEFNRELNAAGRPIEYRLGSLFEPLDRGSEFDLIVMNPPFEYVPEGETYFLHSDGGEDGLDVVRACLDKAPRYLAPEGRFEIITHSPGGGDGPELLDLLIDAFPTADIECHILDFDPIGNHLRLIDEDPTETRQGRLSRRKLEAWRRSLEARGFTHNYFVFCRVATGSPASDVRVRKPVDEIAECWRLAESA